LKREMAFKSFAWAELLLGSAADDNRSSKKISTKRSVAVRKYRRPKTDFKSGK
jgi:hypothetical protein